jgi:hypothetical protein
MLITNRDVGCRASSFEVSLSAPDGFAVSIPTSSISLRSSTTSDYVWAYVTSPSAISDGDYPLTATVTRAGGSSETSSNTSYYKVYSSDTTPPRLFWPNPAPGQMITGSSFSVVVSSDDDHAVKKIDFYMDGAYMSSTACDNLSYTCQLSYQWRVGAPGQHTARFEATDWMGNVGVRSVDFTAG